jgi:hypothetical protein
LDDALGENKKGFGDKVAGIKDKYKAPEGLAGLSIMGGLVRGFQEGSELRKAIKDYDYTDLAERSGLTVDEVQGVIRDLTGETYSGYRDVDGTVTGQKDLRSFAEIAKDKMDPKTYDDIDEFGNIADDGTMPKTTGVETARVTEEGTVGQVAQENVDVTRKVAEFEGLFDQTDASPQEKIDFLNDIIAGKETELNFMDRTGREIVFTPGADLPTLKTETTAAEILRNKIQDDIKPAATTTTRKPKFAEIDAEGVVAEETRLQQEAARQGQQNKEEVDRQTQNYRNKGYSPADAKNAARNKVDADAAAKQQARDSGQSEATVAKTTAVTDSNGNAVTSGSDGSIVTSGPKDDDPSPSKIVCTEMYRQTQLDDWKEAIKIWGVHQKKYLTPYHEKGYHWLFKPWVRGMRKSVILTSVGAYLAKARTQHLKHILTHGKAKDDIVGNIWCKIVHPLTYIAGRTKEWLKL